MNLLVEELQLLDIQPDSFYLTGSRFFGTAHLYSDWDFFVQDSVFVMDWLLDCKYEIISKPPQDELVQCVLFKRGPMFHIQIVSDAELKLRARDWIKGNLTYHKYDKEQHRKIWADAYAICRTSVSTPP
jgi:hypothetical protein